MFTQPNGKPIDPRRDLDEWKSILAEAEIRDARLHDARHTAATVLLLLGVQDRAVMDFMGWSTVGHEAAVHARDRRATARGGRVTHAGSGTDRTVGSGGLGPPTT